MQITVWSNVPRDLPGWDDAMRLLRSAGHEIVDPGPEDLGVDKAGQYLRDAAAVIVGLNEIGREVIEHLISAVVVAKVGVGVDNVDIDAISERGILLCNTPGANASAVADHALALMLGVLRRIPFLDARVRQGKGWDQWPVVGGELADSTVGLVGSGRIGREVAKRVSGFGAKVIAFDMQPDAAWASRAGVEYCSLDQLVSDSDVVSLHLPLTTSTTQIIGHKQLTAMKPTAVLVNTARGGLIDESALVEALRLGRLGGAGLDVFSAEPITATPLSSFENVVLTPHVGGFSGPAARRARMTMAENILAALDGTPQNVVNRNLL